MTRRIIVSSSILFDCANLYLKMYVYKTFKYRYAMAAKHAFVNNYANFDFSYERDD